ncbi:MULTISPECIES: site-specific integrase [Rhodopseudomonas]|uniref:Integrase n=1 Tax=Rhodopseudomonas palustris TaxID=1076 RepID=A0A0D7F2L5_RHOPL|nr:MULTISPECIES: site-specific integrase [Rhodopseudomonas]KIZ47274.1 integrase [Rhodopseudomonas palustris]MDF3809962.1 site-specific integrase [Rhodopseudomonas sp. BAL398]WOK20478.1 site-specific integrase [Rhodopseudomonas sp. BAL398]
MAELGITLRTVQSLGPGETIWDAGHREAVRGFGVRRQRGAPVYVLKYRAHGRQRFFTIGPHGSPWTPERARREAKRLLGLVADGKDPADKRAEAALQAADTLLKIADQYLKHAKQKQRPKTYSEIERYLLTAWKPLHPVSVFLIKRRHVAIRIAELATGQGAVTAARARAALSAMFNWAIREGLDIPANPVLGTNRPAAPRSRDRVLADGELAEIWAALGDDDYGRIVKLLLLTAQRREEVGSMRRTELDLDNSVWKIPGNRTKNHREHKVPLTKAAIALIPLPRGNREYVFGDGPRREGDNHRGYSGWSKSKAGLDARLLAVRQKALDAGVAAEPLPDWHLHDLRRTAATVMADRLGVFPHIVEAVLNHVSGHRAGVAGVYNLARYETDMRAALNAWADHIKDIVAS